MKIAYFTPLNPQKSGISDFAEELLPCLRRLNGEIDLFTAAAAPSNPKIKEAFRVYDVDAYRSAKQPYDLAVYQVGNNYACHHEIVDAFLENGGILELHDVSLHHFLAEETINRKQFQKYIDIMAYCHGENGKREAEKFIEGQIPPPWETNSGIFTVNKHLIDRAQAVIVHSDFAKQSVKALRPDLPVACIFHHTADLVENYTEFKQECRNKLKIDNKLIFGSFGFATRNKRILSVLNALVKFKKQRSDSFHYYIVGEAEPVMVEQVQKLGLQNEVTITGYVPLDDFKTYMGACDLCLNLRYPTQGETSGSLHRMFGFGKPVIVTKIGAFEEYPDDIAVKVCYDEQEEDDIYRALCELTENGRELEERGSRALKFAKDNCSLKKNAERYLSFFRNVVEGNYHDDFTDFFLDRLFASGLTEDDYLRHLLKDKKLSAILD